MTNNPAFDVVAFGELVIDLVPARSAEGESCFALKPGGAPGNVAVGVARLGGRVAMLSKVGDDAFGRLLIDALKGNGVDVEGVLTAREGNTSLAVVTIDAAGDRGFLLYRKGCAESTYAPEEVAIDRIAKARILHAGSLLLGEPLCGAAQRRAVRVARDAGALISIDVNLRPSLWPSADAMRAVALEAANEADLLKMSVEELAIMTQTSDLDEGLARLGGSRRRLTAVTFGPGGALLVSGALRARASGYAVKVADTVGCGDAFMASLLADIAAGRAALESEEGLARIVRRACAAGALVASRHGAMDALPSTAERDAFLATR